MPKFLVTLHRTRTIVEAGVMEVEAADEEAAKALAVSDAVHDYDIDWEDAFPSHDDTEDHKFVVAEIEPDGDAE